MPPIPNLNELVLIVVMVGVVVLPEVARIILKTPHVKPARPQNEEPHGT